MEKIQEDITSGKFIGIIAGSVIAIIAFFYFGVAGCNRVTPTEVGFRINNSGDYRGLDSLPTVTGYNWTQPGFNYIVQMPTTQQHVIWGGDNEIPVSCLGGAGFKMDIGFNYRVNPFLASKIYLKYRTDDLSTITDTYLKNVVRGTMQDQSGTMTVDSMLNNLPFYEHTVAKNLTERLAKEGFIVDNFSLQKQPIPSDANLAAAINAKITARQSAETSKMQLQQSIAEANKLVATARGDSAQKVINALADAEVVRVTAVAEANAIKVKTEALTSSPQYLELRKIEKWTGNVPTTILAGGSVPMLNIK